MILATERTGLRVLTEEDARGLATDDLESTTYLGYMGGIFDPDRRAAWYATTRADPTMRVFAIEARTDTALDCIGYVLLKGINFERGLAEFGINIPNQQWWGRGHGTEATGLMLEYAFVHLSLYNVYLFTAAYNLRARRAYERAGFREAGRQRGAMLLDGRRYDHILMDCTRDDPRPRYRAPWIDVIEAAGNAERM